MTPPLQCTRVYKLNKREAKIKRGLNKIGKYKCTAVARRKTFKSKNRTNKIKLLGNTFDMSVYLKEYQVEDRAKNKRSPGDAQNLFFCKNCP